MALDATIGGESANSYQDRTEAGLYFTDHLYATLWTAASNSDKDKALIMACRRLEQEEYVGQKVTTAQALKWPRRNRPGAMQYGIYESFPLTDLNGNGYDADSIPTPFKYAHCELALGFLASNVLGPTGSLSVAGLKAVDLGPIKLEFGSGSALSGTIPNSAMQYLRGLLITTGRIVRA